MELSAGEALNRAIDGDVVVVEKLEDVEVDVRRRSVASGIGKPFLGSPRSKGTIRIPVSRQIQSERSKLQPSIPSMQTA